MQKKHAYGKETESEIERENEIEIPKIRISSYNKRSLQREVETHTTNINKTNCYFLTGNMARNNVLNTESPICEPYDNVLRDQDSLNKHVIRGYPGSSNIYFSPPFANEKITE